MKIIDLTKNYLNSLVREIIGKIPDMPALAKNVTFQRMLILFITALILSLLLTPQIELNHPYFEIGSIAPKDIKTDRDFLVEDKSSTEQKKQELAGHAKYVYDYDSGLAGNLISNIYANFSSVSDVYKQNKENKAPADIGKKTLNVAISEFEKSLGIKLSHEELAFLSRYDFSQDIAEKIVQLIDYLYKKVIVVNSNLTANEFSDGIIVRDLKTQSENEKKDFSTILPLDKITNFLNNEESSILQGISEDVRRNAVSLAIKLIKPNLTFNKNATEKKKQEILAGVKPVFFLVKKNEMIVREGQKISEIDQEKLESFYRKKGQASFSNLSTVLGIFLSIVFLGLVLYYWRTRNWPKKHDRTNIDSLFLSTAAVFQILLVKAGIFLADAINRAFPYLSVEACFYAIPFAAAAMLVAVLTNRNMALVLSIFISFIISFLFENDVKMSLFCFLGSVASSYHVVSCRQRSAFFNAGLFLGLFNVAVIFCLGLISKEVFSMELLIRSAMGMAGGLISGIMVAGMTPLFETIFKYTTDIKLLELANLNQPIFQRMMMEAPGTYHHSVVVASLVEAAAEAIGANPLLAKVSAYYHDIGKLKKPLYFIENQRNGDNKHDKLSPKMSSLVIISHVKDGCEIAQQAKLGKEITNIIREHHGTGLVSFFYEKAKKDKDSSISSLPETDFRYPGPKPQTKEAGLVLLGDVLEASSRALSNPTPARITSLVRDRIEKIFTDGQLDECELTMRDLSKIAEIFTRILNGIFHHRIDYPEHVNREFNIRKDSNGNIDQKLAEKSKA